MGGNKGHKEGRRNSLRVPGGGETPAEGTELQPQPGGTNVAPPRLEGADTALGAGGVSPARGAHLAPGRGRGGSPGPGGLTWLWKASGSCSLRRPQTRALLSSYRVTSPGGGGGGNSPREHMAAPSLGVSPGPTAETAGAPSAGPSAPHPLPTQDAPGSPSPALRPQPPAPPSRSPLPAPASRRSPPRTALAAMGACGTGIKRAAAPVGKLAGTTRGDNATLTDFPPQRRVNISVPCTNALHR